MRGWGPAWAQGPRLPAQLLMAEFRVQVKNIRFASKVPRFESQLCNVLCYLRQIIKVWVKKKQKREGGPSAHFT